MKKAVVVLLSISLIACNGCKNQTSGDTNDIDKALIGRISSFNRESDYSEMYNEYKAIVEHSKEHNCDILSSYRFLELLEFMLYGTWKDESDNTLSYRYIYEDYANTRGSTWLSTTLPSSQKSNNTYYYYTDCRDEKIIIGYKDKITAEKTDNYAISYEQSSICVENLNNGIFYNLVLDNTIAKIEKGNAKLAYIYIAKNIYGFKNPNSVEVTQCYVEYRTKTVYATIQGMNTYGGTIQTKYKLWKRESTDSYYITENNHSYQTRNIDIDELNKKLKYYINNN